MCVLDGLPGGSPDIRTNVHAGNSSNTKVVCDQVDQRPQIGPLVLVQLKHIHDVPAWDNQHVTFRDWVVVGKSG
jgi:hypothetical protein